MSERGGSDIERLWVLDDQVEYDVIAIQSRSMSDPIFPDIDFKK